MILQRFSICLLALSLAIVSAGQAHATLLSDLILGGQPIQVGNLLFADFTYLQTGDMPDPSAINVVPYLAPNGEVGLTFQGAFVDMPGASGSDAVIGYHVSAALLGTTIDGARLTGAPSVLGGPGVISVTQSFQPTNYDDLHSIYAISPGSSLNNSSVTFANSYTSLSVQDSVLAFSAGGVPGLSFFNASFATTSIPIPEPSSVVLLGLGGVALALWSKRRVR